MRRWFVIFVLELAGACAARAQTEGIFADFVTSRGEFTVWLDHERAPRPVASFVGLATGETGWVDERTNVWRSFLSWTIWGENIAISLGFIRGRLPIALRGHFMR